MLTCLSIQYPHVLSIQSDLQDAPPPVADQAKKRLNDDVCHISKLLETALQDIKTARLCKAMDTLENISIYLVSINQENILGRNKLDALSVDCDVASIKDTSRHSIPTDIAVHYCRLGLDIEVTMTIPVRTDPAQSIVSIALEIIAALPELHMSMKLALDIHTSTFKITVRKLGVHTDKKSYPEIMKMIDLMDKRLKCTSCLNDASSINIYI